MAGLNNSHWEQWDKQQAERRERILYVELNNLYLRVERGIDVLTISIANRLRVLVGLLYQTDGFDGSFEIMMNQKLTDYWLLEFEKLPNWNNV